MSTPNAGRDAQNQADAYKGVFAPHQLKFDDGTTIDIPPHPSLRLLDDERLAAYEELLFESESYDRGPEVFIPEQTVKGKDGNDVVLPAQTTPGPLLQPYRKDGVLLKPPFSVRLVQTVLGDETYAKLRAGKINGRRGCAADVQRIWNTQGLDVVRRADADPKSDAGPDVLEVVAEADSERPAKILEPADR